MDSSKVASLDPNRMSEPQSSCLSSQPTLCKASSFSKLNAQAPEFVPRLSPFSSSATSSPSLTSSPLLSSSSSAANLNSSFAIPRPPQLHHVYNGSPPPASFTFGYSPSLQFYNGPGGLLDGRLQQQGLSAFTEAIPAPAVVSAAAVQVISGVPSQPASVKNGGRGRSSYVNRANTSGAASNIYASVEQPTVSKQPSGPRMPDGTKGFSMGRGKPVAIKIA